MFLIFVNDKVRSRNKIKFFLYTDDTKIYIQGQPISEMVNTLNNEIIHVSAWIKSNSFTLKVSKISYIVSSVTYIDEASLNIKIKDNLFSKVYNTKI